MKTYLCYADGSCKKTAGEPGGWGLLIKSPDGSLTEKWGWAIKTANDTMELTAMVEALRFLPAGVEAIVFSDSRAALDDCGRRIEIWKRNDWKNCEPRKLELLKEIAALLLDKELTVEWRWVRGHNGNAGNERADALAAQGAREAKSQLKALPPA